jgi:hypothetical protein
LALTQQGLGVVSLPAKVQPEQLGPPALMR